MKEIQLTQGKVALVDDEDFEWLNKKKWYPANRKTNWYAVTFIAGKMIKMHRYILMLTDPSIFVDHKDGNGLNNQRSNLRIATMSENARNRKSKIGSTSQYLGVSWKTKKKRWYVGIRVENKHLYGGMFKDEREAALAYNAIAEKHFGEFANLNKV